MCFYSKMEHNNSFDLLIAKELQLDTHHVANVIKLLNEGAFEFDKNIREIRDLRVGMTLNGIVTNITAFGAFVDIGVHQDGFVHISQMTDHYIKDPNEVVHLNQKVKVKVLEVDENRKRISLSMRL